MKGMGKEYGRDERKRSKCAKAKRYVRKDVMDEDTNDFL
jgi:hypothetical protein